MMLDVVMRRINCVPREIMCGMRRHCLCGRHLLTSHRCNDILEKWSALSEDRRRIDLSLFLRTFETNVNSVLLREYAYEA